MKTLYLPSVYHLTVEMLTKMGVKCIFLDVDNTIKKYAETMPSDETLKLISSFQESGIKVILCSNNFKKRIKPYADLLDCDFVSFSLKPSPLGMVRAYFKSKVKHSEILLIGDQVFNDIFAGKLFGIKTMLVGGIDRENEPSTVTARRRMFRYFENKILSNNNIKTGGRSK